MEKMIHREWNGNGHEEFNVVNTYGMVLCNDDNSRDSLYVCYWDKNSKSFLYDVSDLFVPYDLWIANTDEGREELKRAMRRNY